MSDINATIGAAIQEARQRRGLSQVALAAAAGLGQSQISQWERGEHVPGIGSLVALADAMEIGVDDLIELARAEG